MAILAQANVIFTRWATQTELQNQTEHLLANILSAPTQSTTRTSTTSTSTTTRKCVGVCITSCEQIALL